MKKVKVVVGIPSGQFWNAKFGVDLVNMIAYCANRPFPGWQAQEVQIVNTRSSILARNRHDIVKAAQKLQADYLLFLDTDHTFPKELLHRLISHELPIVAANCVTKSIPASPTARSLGGPQGEPVFTDPDRHDLEEVWRVGTGVMLIRMDVFEKIDGSCWEMKYLPHADTYQGEDWSFCEACEKALLPIYVDHSVSNRVGHEGNLVYTHELVGTLG